MRLAGRPRGLAGFTLVELLVVIAIIGILIALLLPAVQAAREAARRMKCANQIAQLSKAFLHFESSHGHFPSGGWGYQWGPHPGRGVGVDQPGGWSYSLLPYLELGTLRDLGASADPNSMTEPELSVKALYEMPCDIWSCPSRRLSVAHPLPSSASPIARKPKLCATLTHQILTDYAANAGDVYIPWPPGPGTLQEGDSGAYDFGSSKNGTGIMAAHFFTRLNDITDGTSHTYLVGEKYLDPDAYEGGISKGDNQGPYTSEDEDSSRWGAVSGTSTSILLPMQDRAGLESTMHFGSAHAGSLNMGMCDGSVRSISYNIDPLAHQAMANRQDGSTVRSGSGG